MFTTLFKMLVILILLTGLGLTSGGPKPSDDSTSLSDLNSLIGTWSRATPNGHVLEEWIKVSERTFEGLAYRSKDGERTVTEFFRLEQFGSEIFYTAKVPENPYPVAFKLVSFADNVATFENLNHDFPQRIIYMLKRDGSLHARIEGPQNGETVGIDFVFSRASETKK